MASDDGVEEVSRSIVTSLMSLPLPWELTLVLDGEGMVSVEDDAQPVLFDEPGRPTVLAEGAPPVRWYATSDRERHASRRRRSYPCVSHRELAVLALGAERGVVTSLSLRSLLLDQPGRIGAQHYTAPIQPDAVPTYDLGHALGQARASVVGVDVVEDEGMR